MAWAWTLAIPIVIGWFFVAAGCRPPEEPVEIRIGFIGPLSGPLREHVGGPLLEGVELAITHAEARGVVLDGRRAEVRILFEDSRDRSETALEAARKLIYKDRVAALVGPCLGRTALAVAAFAERHQVPMISPSTSHPELTVGKPFVFRATIVDDQQAQALAQFSREDLAATTAAVLFDGASAYNRGLAELYRQGFSASGGQVVAFEEYATGERDFRDALTRIRDTQPDVLFLPNYADEVPIQARQARELGLDSVLLGADSWDTEDYPRQDVFSGSFFANDWLPEATDEGREEERAFVEAYEAAYDRAPTILTALAYDAMGLLLSAVERRGSLEGDAIRQAIADADGYRGVTGVLSFRGGGDPAKPVRIYAIRDGGLSFVQQIGSDPVER